MPGTLGKVTTRPGTEIVPDVEIFAASDHNRYALKMADGSERSYRFTAAELAKVRSNFHELYDGAPNGTRLKPIVTVRHVRDKDIAEADARCHGVVARDLRQVGDKLVASFADVPPATRAAIRRGEYRNCSAEIIPEFSDRGRDFGPVLYRVALLGDQQPRNKGIAELPFADDPDGPLDVVLCFADSLPIPEAAVSTAAETAPTPTPAANPAAPAAPVPDPRLDKLLAFADRLPELLAVADRLPQIQASIERATADAATATRLESERLEREKRDKVKRFLDSPGVCFADDSRQLRVMPVQRAFIEESLLALDASTVLTFADGDQQVQGTALDRKMAEIRRWPPTLHFAEKMGQPQPGQAVGETPVPQVEIDRLMSLTPMGKGIVARRNEQLALTAAK